MQETKQLLEKLDNIEIRLYNLEQSNQILCDEVESITITEMAQLQGSDSTFFYFTLEREPLSYYPHVHICIKSETRGWNGKFLGNGSAYIDLGAIRLLTTKQYTMDNLVLEHIRDLKITTRKNKKLFVAWLNSTYKNKKKEKLNGLKCLDDYLMSNSDCVYKDSYENWLDKIYN